MTTTKKPKFITFCGADDVLQLHDMVGLSSAYPVEWGILLSPERSNRETPRYPGLGFFEQLTELQKRYSLNLSLHLCGGFVEQLLVEGGLTWLVDNWVREYFSRVQINVGPKQQQYATPENLERAIQWVQERKSKTILRSTMLTEFPHERTFQYTVSWLFDASAGTGAEPTDWPSEPTNRLVGYAGGIGPANVVQVVSVVGERAENYWLDMETKIRSEDLDDKFSVEKCLAVCKAVYGAPVAPR